MSVCIFVGPTLPVADAKRVLDGLYLPPAKLGDVQRAVSLLKPRAVGVIDGYFQWAPAVWHKELLWAIDQGVHVFGSASMGALRAAELEPFGMRGVGRIFKAYRDGLLEGMGDDPFEDDDEVAVVHGPPESGYVGASEAMVNIRCTLQDAVRGRVIADATRLRLVAIAKSIFFPERDYGLILERARAEGLPEGELAALEQWLAAGSVNQKRADAVAMLEEMRDFVAGNPPPMKAGFTFERTTLWERAAAAFRAAHAHEPAETAVLEELRLDAPRSEALRQEALRSLLDTGSAEAEGEPNSDPDDDSAGFPDSEQRIERAARREAGRRLRAQVPTALVERRMLALIRKAGSYESLLTRAEDKRARLAAFPALPHIEDFSELQLLELRDWYFSTVVRADMPDDLEDWLRDAGHPSEEAFHRAIFAEYLYRRTRHGDRRENNETTE